MIYNDYHVYVPKDTRENMQNTIFTLLRRGKKDSKKNKEIHHLARTLECIFYYNAMSLEKYENKNTVYQRIKILSNMKKYKPMMDILLGNFNHNTLLEKFEGLPYKNNIRYNMIKSLFTDWMENVFPRFIPEEEISRAFLIMQVHATQNQEMIEYTGTLKDNILLFYEMFAHDIKTTTFMLFFFLHERTFIQQYPSIVTIVLHQYGYNIHLLPVIVHIWAFSICKGNILEHTMRYAEYFDFKCDYLFMLIENIRMEHNPIYFDILMENYQKQFIHNYKKNIIKILLSMLHVASIFAGMENYLCLSISYTYFIQCTYKMKKKMILKRLHI
jgi:hypothetical protein